MESESIGKRIRQVREDHGLTLREVSDRTGLTVNGISRVELGRTVPTAATIAKLARGLEVDPGELFPKVGAPLHDAGEEQRRKMLEAIQRYAHRRVNDFQRELNDPHSAHFANATSVTNWVEMVAVEAKTWSDWALENYSVLMRSDEREFDVRSSIRDSLQILGHLLTIHRLTDEANKRIKAMSDMPDELAVRRMQKSLQESQESQKHFQERSGTA